MSAACCPDTPRIAGATLKDGTPVLDLHEHKNLLRGFIAGSERPTHWTLRGRLSPLAACDHDLVGVRHGA